MTRISTVIALLASLTTLFGQSQVIASPVTVLPPRVEHLNPIVSPITLQTSLDLSGPSVKLTGHRPAIADASVDLGRKPDTDQVTIMFALKPRDKPGMDDLARRLYDPNDPLYHRFLTVEQRIARFSPLPEDAAKVEYYAQQCGLSVTDVSPDRTTFKATGTAAAIDRSFGITLHNYSRRADGTTFYAPDTDPTIPAVIGSLIDGVCVDSATNDPKPQMIMQPSPAHRANGSPQVEPLYTGVYAGPGLTAGATRKAYDLSLHLTDGTPINGAGQSAALVELGGFQASDIGYYRYYNAEFALPLIDLGAPALQPIAVDNSNLGLLAPYTNECELDIEMLNAVADGLNQILVYVATPGVGLGLYDAINMAAMDDTASVVSISYGTPESSWSSGLLAAYLAKTEIMSLQGQAVFAASGDTGAYWGGQNLEVNGYASSPWVTGVGGTTLNLDVNPFDSNYLGYSSESVWNNTTGATGGGISEFFACPSYQANYFQYNPASLQSPASTFTRNVPDVTLDSDPECGYYAHLAYDIGGTYDPDGIDYSIGGTSAASPLWAAFWTQVNQYRTLNGQSQMGFANPALYNDALTQNYNNDFHDVTNYNNGFFQATTGYDCASGLGSMNGLNLASDLAFAPVYTDILALVPPSSATSGQQMTFTVVLDDNDQDSGFEVDILQYPGTSAYGQGTNVGSVQIPVGSTQGTLQITAPSVSTQSNFTYTAQIHIGLVDGPPSPAVTVVINPNTISSVNVSPATVDQSAIGTVTLNAPADENEVLSLSSSVPSVASVPATVTVPAGQSNATFAITSVPQESPLQVTVTASPSASDLATGSVTGIFTVEHLLSTVTAAPVSSRDTAVGTIELSSAAATDCVIHLKSASTLLSVPATVTVPAGASSATFTLTAGAVATARSIKLVASEGKVQATAIVDVHPVAASAKLSISPAIVAGSLPSGGAVTLDFPAGSQGATVALSTSSKYASVPASVIVAPGLTTATFTIATKSVTKSVTADIRATFDGSTKTKSLAIVPETVASISFLQQTLFGPQITIGEVTLSEPAPAGGVTVQLTSSNPNVAATTVSSVTIVQGQTTYPVALSTAYVTTTSNATITATLGASSASTVITDEPV